MSELLLEDQTTTPPRLVPAQADASGNLKTTATVGPAAPTDPGQNLSLSDTNAHQFAAAGATCGVFVSCPLTNTAPVYVGFGSGLTTSTGVELQPGDREFFPVTNANKLFAITGTATQNVHAVAC